MFISDLEHMNLVTEESDVLGGGKKRRRRKGHNDGKNGGGKKKVSLSLAYADGDSDAVAFGGKINVAFADTKAYTATFPGFAAASSKSKAFSASVGKY